MGDKRKDKKEMEVEDAAREFVDAFVSRHSPESVRNIGLKMDEDRAPTSDWCPEVEGRKYDKGKPPLTRGCLHYFPRALEAVALVSAYGKYKYETTYEEANWRNVEEGEGRYLDALGRHALSIGYEPYDTESSFLHAAQAAWNALAYLEKVLEYRDLRLEDSDVS